MVGLRTCETDKFVRFFEIVQKAAMEKGCVFFLDSGENHIFENETMEYDDLSGWLIPSNKAPEFEKEYFKGGDPKDHWYDYYCFAVWENEKNPIIRFKWY